jgi:hypothetical protein
VSDNLPPGTARASHDHAAPQNGHCQYSSLFVTPRLRHVVTLNAFRDRCAQRVFGAARKQNRHELARERWLERGRPRAQIGSYGVD